MPSVIYRDPKIKINAVIYKDTTVRVKKLKVGTPVRKVTAGAFDISNLGGTDVTGKTSGSILAYQALGGKWETTNFATGNNISIVFDSAANTFTFGTNAALTDVTSLDATTTGTIRSKVSVTDTGGDGSLAYNNSTGVITYTGPSAAEVRAHFSAGGDLSYNSSTGQFSFDVENVYTKANFDSDLGVANTGQLPEGSNLYYTTTRADSDFDTRLATKDTDNLTEGSNLYYTEARFDARLATKNTDNLTEGDNLYYTTARADSDFDTRLTTKNTDNLAEGSNLYYTTARANADFDTRLATKDTDNLAEGDNLYYTDARARSSITISDVGGDGSLGYNSSTGVITYTGPSASEARAHVSAVDGGGDGSFTYNSSTGAFTYTGPSPNEVRAHITANKGLNINSGELNIDSDNVKGMFSGGTGVTYNNGVISIGQPVATSSDVTFNDVVVSGNLTISGTQTTVDTETLLLADNVIVVNSNATGSPTENGGIEVERGDATNKTLIWNEAIDKWTIGSETFVAGTFEGNLTGNVTGNVVGNVTGNVTGQTSDISNHNTGDLTEGSNLYYTDARANTAFDTRLATKTTTNLTEGDNLYYTDTRANSAFDTRLGTKDTDDLAEGSTNQYHTTARARGSVSASGDLSYNSTTGVFSIDVEEAYTKVNFDSDLSAANTGQLPEGSNLYYTDVRADARITNALIDEDNMVSNSATKLPSQQSVKAYVDAQTTDETAEGSSNLYHTTARARGAVSVTDAGGDGSLAYNSGTGVVTYTGPSASEVRAHFSAAGDLSYNSSTGQFSFDVESVYTKENFDSDLGLALAGGTGITYDSAGDVISITNTGVTAATYGSSTSVPQIAVNEQGQITSASNVTIAGVTGVDFDSANGTITIQTTGGNFTDVVTLDPYTTADLTENTNLYYTNARADARITAALIDEDDMTSNSATRLPSQQSVKAYVDSQVQSKDDLSELSGTTDDVTEGSTNLYHTDARVDARITTASVTATGALMDSELTDLAGVKGVTISTLQPKPSEGAFVNGDKTKLDAIESGATADQTDAEIKTAYENNSNTNAFTDADHTKLDGIETGATADQTDAEIRTAVESATDSNVFTDADHTKLNAIEASATADQTDAEIKTAYENNSDTNAFTDAEKTKLTNIEASADVTDTTNVTAAGALMDSELTDLAGVKGVTISTLQVKPTEGAFADGDKTKLDGIEASADVTDTDNVTAAGALMDSELTDLAGVKGVTISTLQVKPTEGAFVDGDKTKLDGIEASADVTDTTNVTSAGALMDSELASIADVKALDQSVISGASPTFTTTNMSDATNKRFMTDAQESKLDAIEASATADQTDAEIRAAVEAATNSNVFTDSDHSKLNAIELLADVTDTANVTAAGALMDSEVDADIKTLSLPANTTISAFGKTLVDDADAATARTTIGVDASGTDNSTDVTLAGSLDYITISGQEITRNAINLSTDVTGTLPISNMAATALTTVQTAANESAHLALTAQEGDVVVRSDQNKTYMHNGGTAGTMADYTLLATPTDAVTSVNGNTGVVTVTENVTTNLGITGTTGARTITSSDGTDAVIPVATDSVSGVMSSADHTKLTGIETSADVTDTANVTSAGALMDSEVTNLAQVKAFDTSDYATSAQGTKADSALQNVVEDTSPQLGGNLDLNSNNITGTGNIDIAGKLTLESSDPEIFLVDTTTNVTTSIDANSSAGSVQIHVDKNETGSNPRFIVNVGSQDAVLRAMTSGIDVIGNITVTGTVDGRDVATDGTKLDGVEASADVTDTTNVTAAGALMDSELTDLAGVKGVTISTLQPKPSEGAFANGDKTKLDGIEASADVTDTTNVTAAGALMDSELTDLAGVKGVTISTLQVKPSEGAFADGDKTKLDGIEASADVTDATNVTAAGALMDSELASIADVKALDQSVVSGASPTFGTANMTDASNKRFMSDAQETKLDSVESSATADQTAAEILTAIKTVDGASSGLDADLLDGVQGASYLRSDANDTFTGNLTVAGKIGLGDADTVADHELHIQSDSPTIRLEDTGGNQRFDITHNFVTTTFDYETNVLFKRQDGTEIFRIDADGIDVTGKAKISASSTLNAPSLGNSSDNAQLQLTNNDTAYGLVVGNSSADGHVWLQAQRTDGTATAYNISLNEAGGNVGIGSSAPTSLLHLASNAPYITFEDIDNNQDWQIQATAWFAIRDQTANAERMRIDSSGNMAIGYTSSSHKLSVNGGVMANSGFVIGSAGDNYLYGDTDIVNLRVGASGSYRYFQFTDTGTGGSRIGTAGGDLHLGISTNNYLTIDTSGNVIIPSGDLDMPDSAKIKLGTGDDLQLYHDGTHSWIRDTGTGALFLDTNSAIHLYANGTENMLYAQPNAGVQIFYDNVKKLETTSSGIDVTGTVTSDELTVDTTASNGVTINAHDNATTTYPLKISNAAGSGNLELGTYGINNNIDLKLQRGGSTKLTVTSSGIDVTGTVEFNGLSGTGAVSVTDILDEDNMASNSATALATQQSIKAYIDNNAGGGSGDITAVVAGAGLTGGATSGSATLNVNHLPATDDRDMKPNTSGIGGTTNTKAIKSFFTTLGGMTGTANSDYQDALVLDTYSDTSGGNANCLIFDKTAGTYIIKHYNAAMTATTWGTPKTLAYAEDTLALAGGTMTGNLTIEKSDAKIVLRDTGGNPDDQAMAIRQEAIDSNLPSNLQSAVIIEDASANGYTTGLVVEGQIYANSSDLVWNAGNDGAGSGLDADTLDGVQGASYLRSDANDTFTGNLTLVGELYFTDTNTKISEGSGNAVRVTTDSGYIEIGPQNTSNAHIQTDRAKFYFNKRILVDEGIISAYNEDLQLRRTASDTTNQLTIGSGLATFGTQVSMPTLRITSTTDASNSSTGHGLQIGSTSSTNIVIDNNEIIARNNGTASQLILSNDGGETMLGGDLKLPNKIIHRDDTDTYLQFHAADEFRVVVAGNERFEVTNTNVTIPVDMTIADQIIHQGDTNTYMQFHAADQWRVVTGGSERLEVNNTATTVAGNLLVADQIRVGDDCWIEDFNVANSIRIKGNQSNANGFIAFGQQTTLLGCTGNSTLTYGGNTVWHAGNDGSGSGLDADTVDGLQVGTGRNNSANQIVRTDGSGYAQMGWINTTSGATSSTINRIYCSADGYIRYMTPANLFNQQASALLTAIKTVDGDTSGLHSELSQSVTGSAFATTGSPESRLEYQQASGQSDTKLAPNTEWHNTIRMGHGNPYSYYSNTLAMRMTGTGTGSIFTQTIINNVAQGWKTVWDSSNDGSGSGLDADTLDGIQGSSYLRSDASDTFTGTLTMAGQLQMNGNIINDVEDIYLRDKMYHDADTNTYFGFSSDTMNFFTGGTRRLLVNNTGVSVTGTMVATGDVTAFSDEKLKENIEVIPNAIEKVSQIRGVTFTRNDVEDKEKVYTGVIAQEVEKVLPEVVSTTEDDTKTVAYGNMVGLLIEAVKEQQEQINELKKQIEEMK